MASDHRGREVHAGKRTVQESVNWQNSPDEWSAHTGSSRLAAQHNGNDLVVHTYPDHEEANWAVTRGPYDEDADLEEVMFRRQVGGRQHIGSGFKFNNGTMGFDGRTRTARRAMIAAEAMSNRIKEGRNLKTGRPLE